jgi:hypothetical protein
LASTSFFRASARRRSAVCRDRLPLTSCGGAFCVLDGAAATAAATRCFDAPDWRWRAAAG